MNQERKIKRKAQKQLARQVLHNIQFIAQQRSVQKQQYYMTRLVQDLRSVARLD